MSERRSHLRPCPFAQCRNPDTMLVEMEIEDLFSFGRIERSWRVICPKCGVQGPWGGPGDRGKHKAAQLWNDRATQ